MEVERPTGLKADAMELDAAGPRGGAPAPPTDDAPTDDGDLYTRLKALQRQLEFYEIQVGAVWGRVGGWAQAGGGESKHVARCAHRCVLRVCSAPSLTRLPPHTHTTGGVHSRGAALPEARAAARAGGGEADSVRCDWEEGMVGWGEGVSAVVRGRSLDCGSLGTLA